MWGKVLLCLLHPLPPHRTARLQLSCWMEDEHPQPGCCEWGKTLHCDPSNTALLKELVIALPSATGWDHKCFLHGMGRFLVRPLSLLSSSWQGWVFLLLCTVHGRAKMDNSGLADVGRRGPSGSAAVHSMSCLILKLFQASEDP